MLIVGEKESADGTVSIRKRFEGDLGVKTLDQYKEILNDALISKKYEVYK